MKRLGRRVTAAAIACMLGGAAVGLAVAPANANSHSVLTKGQTRQALLTLKEAATASRVAYPSTANGLVCHTAPYLTATVNYCYYEYLHSDRAFAAGTAFANHVDLLAFQSTKAARAYIKEMKASRPATSVLNQTSTSVVFFDQAWDIATPPAATGGTPGTTKGPTVSVFSQRGTNVAYIACANPKATDSSALASCATALAKAQLANIR